MPKRSPWISWCSPFLLFKSNWHVAVLLIVNSPVIHEVNLLKGWLSHPIEGVWWSLITQFITEGGTGSLSGDIACLLSRYTFVPSGLDSDSPFIFHSHPSHRLWRCPCSRWLTAVMTATTWYLVSEWFSPNFSLTFRSSAALLHSSSRPVDSSWKFIEWKVLNWFPCNR